MAKKFLSALLAVLMVISMVPMAAMAEGEFTAAEKVPTLAVGANDSNTDAVAAIKKAVGASDVTLEGDQGNILWFAMTGLGADNYSLSVKSASGAELLGDKYVGYDKETRNFKPTGEKYLIYVSLDNKAAGGEGQQVNEDALADGAYTVTLTNQDTGRVVATETITLASTESGAKWNGKQTTNAGGIEFKVASQGQFDKGLSDLQTGTPTFNVTSAGTNKWNVEVGGASVKYVSDYTGFNGTLTQEQHGYYLGISIPKAVNGNIVSKMTLPYLDENGKPDTKDLTADVFTEYNDSYCDLIIRLGETAEEAKAASKAIKLTYGGIAEQTYTFTFSGLTFPSEKVEAKAIDGTVLGKQTSTIQSNIVAETNEETKTITVTGTAYQVKEAWTEYSGSNNTGYFVALELTNPAGVAMQLYSPTEDLWKNIDNSGADKGKILTRLDNLKEDGYKGKIKVGANEEGGTEWTIDYSGVDMLEATTDLQVDAFDGLINLEGSSKKGSDLQSDITFSRKKANNVTTISFRGNSNYIPKWTQFSSIPAEQEGNYIALKLTADGTIKVGESALTADGQLVVILRESNDYKVNVTVTHKNAENQDVTDKYVLDFSAVKRLPAEIKGVELADGNTLTGLMPDYKDGKIVLSGMVEPKSSNENLFNDGKIKIDLGEDNKKDVTIRFIKNGDKLEAAADPAVIAGNTLEFDTSMLFIKSANATDDATTAAPVPSVSETIPEEQKEAAKEISKALANNKTKIEEAIFQKYAYEVSNNSAAKETLVADAAKIVAENADKVPETLKVNIEAAVEDGLDGVSTIVQTYAKIDVVSVETSEDGTTSFEISITPMARTVVSTVADPSKVQLFDPNATEANANRRANAIVVKDEEVKIGESTKVTLALPDAYKAATAFIKHVKDSGEAYVYEGKITGASPRILEFTSEHGFSSFTISAEKPVLDPSSDATLSEVKVGEYEVTKVDNAYTVKVPEGTDVTKLPLTLTATDSKIKGITVNGTAYTEGMEVDLTTAATIVVTAEDGSTATYTLTADDGTVAPPKPWENPFTDVKEGAWYYNAVKYANENGLMDGTSADKFSPRVNLTRAQFAQILYNAEGNPDVTWTDKFSDVKEGAWYAKAVIWAAENNVLAGYANGTARPNSIVTREDLVSLLWRYAGKPAPTGTTLDFSDASKVSSYAKDALLWAVENKIISGRANGELDPKGNAQRAEAAQMLMQYFSNK